MNPPLYRVMPCEQKEIAELVKVLDTIKAQKTQLNNQLHSIRGKAAQKVLKKLFEKLAKEIAAIEEKIEQLIKKHPSLSEKFNLLITIKGIGKMTAFYILARMPDVQYFASAKQFAAYIGITPKQHQSGKLVGKTTLSKLGDRRLRKALYRAALVAKQHNQALHAFVQRLRLKRKAPISQRNISHISYFFVLCSSI